MPDTARSQRLYVALQNRQARIRTSQIVKRFERIPAVEGLELDAPYGARAGCWAERRREATTTTTLTVQVILDEGEIEVLGSWRPGDSKLSSAADDEWEHLIEALGATTPRRSRPGNRGRSRRL